MGRFFEDCHDRIYERLMLYDSTCENGMFDRADGVLDCVTFADYYGHVIHESDPGRVNDWVNKKYSEITSREERL